MIVGTGHTLSLYFRRMGRRTPQIMLEVEQENARTVLNKLIEFSSGDISAEELKQLGHPYRWGGSPPQDPAIINVQERNFVGFWHQDGPRVRPGGAIVTVFENLSPQAPFLLDPEGTDRMQPRPIVERVMEDVQGIIEERRDEAIERILSESGLGGNR